MLFAEHNTWVLMNSGAENIFNVSGDNLLGRLRKKVSERAGVATPARVHRHLRYQSESGQGSQVMKSRRAIALTLPSKPCQRPGCPHLSRMRLQEHGRITRSLYLCDWCLESLLAVHINDLFLKFGAILKDRHPAKLKVSPRDTKSTFP
jgi:hypothetical protein